MSEKQPLEDRVKAFSAMELPGQPRMMHVGTSYLVNDLWSEIKRLRGELAHHCSSTLTKEEYERIVSKGY